jgi:Glycosyl hydrolases family 2, sugar binding domain
VSSSIDAVILMHYKEVRTEEPDIFHNISHSENEGALAPKEPGENATGLYRKTFTLPEKWVSSVKSSKQGKGKGKKEGRSEGGTDRVFMVFEGVDCCANFWLNGVYIGFSKDSCLPCEFDVTDAIASSSSSSVEHLLAVQVIRWSDASYLEDQDKWWLSGGPTLPFSFILCLTFVAFRCIVSFYEILCRV